ncbi:ATP-binding cassette domain-containing protein [Bacteroides xylanisolvens]|uniref:ATP-binding cassette domain-containing protein n=1 Tax=Bacteroides xylanisolvens TaxID=371601 RepID=UPI001FB7F3DB|nr:ATP-binding cassette domain-containing protein [Bacteroides xylanisolvens]
MNKQFIITNFAAFALMLFLPTGCRQADGKQDAVQSYRVIKVAASPVEISESYSAAIRGRQDVDILPQISGRIIRLKVKEGERVKTGQVLAVIDQVPYRAALRTAQANVSAAQAKVETARIELRGKQALFENASFQIPLGAKVALTGGNGTGKTTLIQMILNHEEGISISPKAKIGYFAQNGYKYNSNQNVMEFMQEDCDYNISEIRSVLASMGFKQNDIGKSLSVLSGGEIIKLLLAKMLMGRYNILLMDEPSNFLDIPSLEALEILMKEYAGTIVFITHDKRLLENVADVVYEIRDKKINLKH